MPDETPAASRTALVAVGGNALLHAGQRGTIDEQLANAHVTARSLARMVKQGWRLVLTHGNGPQVGAALLRTEAAADEVYRHPLDVCVATTQSEIGYLLQRALEYELRQIGLTTPVMTVLTQVRVDAGDPALSRPTKPVGPFYTPEAAEAKRRTHGWAMIEDPARGFRRVVPSPEPVEVFEQEIIRIILDSGMIPIAVGGGGIPVIEEENHRVVGCEAVIDKDRASALLAAGLGVDLLLICTNIDRICLDFRLPTRRGLDSLTVAEARAHLADGQFPPGSMGPKVEAAIRYLEQGGREVVVTSIARMLDAVEGRAGTRLVP